MNYRIVMSDELEHHGILGQKWGKKNGPPYPLDASDHSSSEKKAGWKKSLSVSGSKDKDTNRTHKLTDEQKTKLKKVMKVGAIAVGAGLAAYGTYTLAKNGKLDPVINAGKKAMLNFQKVDSKVIAINPKVAVKQKMGNTLQKAGNKISKEAKDWANIAKEASKKRYQGMKDGAPEAAYETGKKISKVMVGGMTWLAGMEVADLMTGGAATDKILNAYNDHQKKENKVKAPNKN